MIYLTSILVGAATLIVTVTISSAIALALVVRFPQLALRIFPVQRFDLQSGEYDFPLTQIVAAGAVGLHYRLWMDAETILS